MVKVYKSREVIYPIEKNIVEAISMKAMNIAKEDHEMIKEKEKHAEEIVNKALSKEKKIIEEAKLKAEEILKEAKQKSMEIYSKAKDDGYKAGVKEAGSLIKEAEDKAAGIIEDAKVEKQNILNSMSMEIIDLSFSIAEKILCYEIEKNENAFISIINCAANKVDDKEIVVLINEEDYMNHYAVLSEDRRVEPDDSLKKGDIKILSKKGIIEAGIGKQLEKAKLVAGV